jgi:tetratricopeptide (TPR) repeat protein
MGLLDGIPEDQDKQPKDDARKGLADAEAFAEAVAAKLADNPEVAHKIIEFLSEQTQLLKVQQEHLQNEHALRISILRSQARESKLRRTGIWLRIAQQIFLVVMAAFIIAGILLMIRDAVTSRRIMIDPFESPPALAATGLNGKVLASSLRDAVSRIQAANRSSAAHLGLSNALTQDIAIDVPQAGPSFGELRRLLRSRFGHDQHIDGDLVQTESGKFALTVRSAELPSKTFTDEPRNLDKLLTQAAEYVYAESQPSLWSAYLVASGRHEEAIRFAKGAYATVKSSERPYLLDAWADALTAIGAAGALPEALSMYRQAVRLKPDFWSAYGGIMFSLSALGEEEGTVSTGEQMLRAAGGRPGRAPEIDYMSYDSAIRDLPAERAEQLASTTGAGSENLRIAEIEVQMHDSEAAAMWINSTSVDDKNARDVAQAMFDRALLAEEAGDLEAAAREWDRFASQYANPAVSSAHAKYMCSAALTYEKTGQPAKADAAIDAVGRLTFVDCARFRGDLLDLRGDWAGAQEWYAKAVQLAPSIPSGYYAWGVALAKHGNLSAAEAKLNDAHGKGPHWADPLKAWGDALLKQGNSKAALAKYDEALKYAPNWTQLKQARQAAHGT